jgi:hypothetical protein
MSAEQRVQRRWEHHLSIFLTVLTFYVYDYAPLPPFWHPGFCFAEPGTPLLDERTSKRGGELILTGNVYSAQ